MTRALPASRRMSVSNWAPPMPELGLPPSSELSAQCSVMTASGSGGRQSSSGPYTRRSSAHVCSPHCAARHRSVEQLQQCWARAGPVPDMLAQREAARTASETLAGARARDGAAHQLLLGADGGHERREPL